MRKLFLYACSLLALQAVQAQTKKPLDHSVYDQWQSVQTPQVSNDGKWVVYMVNPQEGDGELIAQATDGSWKKVLARGYAAVITDDSRYVVFKVKPFFKDTRDARIKKKRPDDMPKDSMGILFLGTDSLRLLPRIKSFKTPDEGAPLFAYHMEKEVVVPKATPKPKPDSAMQIQKMMTMADSLLRMADSIKNKAIEARTKGLQVLQPAKTPRTTTRAAGEPVTEGTTLVLHDFSTGQQKTFSLVSDYYFSKKGNVLILETTRSNSDTLQKELVLWVHTATGKVDTVMKGFQDAKSFAIDEAGTQLAFVAERDSVSKALKKFYKLWYFKPGMDSAVKRVDVQTNGVAKGLTVSPDFQNRFSKSGNRLYIGLAPVREPKDTTLADFEIAKLDIWHYNDDYLQPQQLAQLNNELRKSYLAVVMQASDAVIPLGDENLEQVDIPEENEDGSFALGRNSKPYRIQAQWEMHGYQDLYLVDVTTGIRKLIASKIRGGARISAFGKFVQWYDWKKRHYFIYDIANGKTTNATQLIPVPLWDEEDDHPDDPPPHGVMGWHEQDAFFYVYDKYDIWKVDPSGKSKPENLTGGTGRKMQVTYRNVQLDREQRYVKNGETLLFNAFDNKDKGYGWVTHKEGSAFSLNTDKVVTNPLVFGAAQKAKNGNALVYTAMTPQMSPNLFSLPLSRASEHKIAKQLSDINPQQKQYNWYSVELHKWKMFDGKMSEGLLFKPENFDSTKKYPVIFYFYERNADTRYNYRTPAPSASTINIAYFTSNGYLVFDPNIYYKNGEPGESAYNSVVSAARYLSKMKFVDSTKMAIQGQSWGGYQVAYLVTRTKLFAAAGAGAPVANMYSAYGGIRWGAGISRQFQYEKSQSRLGFTPWQRPDLYTKNSPLFKADKVNTPLLLMHNDKDGAVPWYQSIEFFTALRRLGKKAWLLQYNDEDHNLVERRNRKDLSIRLGQFFDHYLKGSPMPVWMKEGVPATKKGVDWGTQIE